MMGAAGAGGTATGAAGAGAGAGAAAAALPTLADVLEKAGVGKDHVVPVLVAEPREEAFKAFTAALPLVNQAEKIVASKFV